MALHDATRWERTRYVNLEGQRSAGFIATSGFRFKARFDQSGVAAIGMRGCKFDSPESFQQRFWVPLPKRGDTLVTAVTPVGPQPLRVLYGLSAAISASEPPQVSAAR